jgi:hypothetical protein
MKKSILALVTFLIIGNSYAHPYESSFKEAGFIIKTMIYSDFIEIPQKLREIDEYRLTLALEFTKIELKRKELKDKFGRVKCGLNFPDKNLIQFNKDCWEKMDGDLTLLYPFVLHEYLGIMGDEIDNYNTSKLMFDLTRNWQIKILKLKEEDAAAAKKLKEEAEAKAKAEIAEAKKLDLARVAELRPLQMEKIAPKLAKIKVETVAITYQDLITYPTLKEIKSYSMNDVLQIFDLAPVPIRFDHRNVGVYLCDRMGYNTFIRTIDSSEYTPAGLRLFEGLTVEITSNFIKYNSVNYIPCGNI